MTEDITMRCIAFANQKHGLISMLDRGVVVKNLWDELIAEGKELELDNSVGELEKYYEHYRIGEMGSGSFVVEKNIQTIPTQTIPEPMNTRAEAIPETIYKPGPSVRVLDNKLSRPEALKIWQETLADLRKSGQVGVADFDNYVRPLKLKSMSTTKVVLETTIDFIADWLNKNARSSLEEILSKKIGSPVTVAIQVAG